MPKLENKPVTWLKPGPKQPRETFEEDELRGLGESLMRKQLQPILAQPDEPSIACLMRRVPELLALLVRLRFPYQDAEDAVQVALIRGAQWLRTGKVHDLTDRQAWLRTVAIRAARTIARRRKWHALSDSVVPTVAPFDELEQREEERVRMAALLEAVDRLPDDLRHLFVYCKLRGNTIRDASGKFGLPEGTVNGRLIQARWLLRDDLRSQGFDIPEDPRQTRKRRARAYGARL